MVTGEKANVWAKLKMLRPVTAMALAATLTGCGCSSDDDGGAKPGTGGSGGTGQGGTAGTGTGGTAGLGELGIAPATEGNTPFDATPDPEGETIYFTGADPALGSGVFKVPAAGGTVSQVKLGAPFVAPFGITTSSDGATLYVADPGAETGDDAGDIFSMSTSGAAPTSVAGIAGFVPRGVEVISENDADQLYFTGRDSSGVPGVFKVTAAGGTPAKVASGPPFVDPSGVAVAANGDVYVTDTRAPGSKRASVIQVKGAVVEELVTDLHVGYPVGIAISTNGTTLFVSGLDPATQTDVLLRIDIATKATTPWMGDADTDISKFMEPAGMHRAKNKDVFAWVDSKAGANGTVFLIQ